MVQFTGADRPTPSMSPSLIADESFRSFDQTETVPGLRARPERYRDLLACVARSPALIPRGAGLSYCNASAGEDVVAVESSAFDRILAFDASAGTVTVEPGLSVGALLRFVERRGWHLPVVPGHPRITVGGCIGFDVHGKGSWRRGTFGDCVLGLQVLTASGDEVRCTPTEESDLFRATLGGLGLTGFVTSVELALDPVRGASIERERVEVGGLEEAVQVMRELADDCEAMFSWNDLNASGESFGRGYLYVDRPDSSPIDSGEKARSPALGSQRPWRSPWTLLPRGMAPFFTSTYRTLEGWKPRRRHLSLWRSSFPIAGRELYFQLHGRRGFREYQILVPWEAWPEAARSLRALLRASGARTTLGSLKVIAARPGLLRFAGSGVCLTFDAPADATTLGLFSQLDDWVVDLGGLINLSKDGRVEARTVERVFPEFEAFLGLLHRLDPQRRFRSSLRRRVLADV